VDFPFELVVGDTLLVPSNEDRCARSILL